MRLVTGNGTLIEDVNGVMVVTSPEYKGEVTTRRLALAKGRLRGVT